MNFTNVEHRCNDNFCYMANEEELVINLKTGKEITQVFLCYGDPFSAGIMGSQQEWKNTCIEIVEKKELKEQYWWSVRVKPEFKRCRYYFELLSGNERKIYMENGFFDAGYEKKPEMMLEFFTFPWMNPADLMITPEWVKHTIWYQIFPDRFCNGDSKLNKEGVLPWAESNQKVNNEQRYGGDLPGIISKLDYLSELGINGIYLTPINLANSTHRYDTVDYRQIDTDLGDKSTMKTLVSEAHNRGIRIMVDGVFNHTSCFCPMWLDVVEKGKDSVYFDWFFVNNWPLEPLGSNAKKKNYYAFAFIDNMPKLNTNNPEVIQFVLDICEEWIREYDIDGIRLDVANEISHVLCKAMRTRLKAIKEDFYIMGEIWHDSTPWLRGDEFDAVMNYPFTGAISNFWTDKRLTAKDFAYNIQRCYCMYMEQVNQVAFNLLDSHDTIRAVTKIGSQDKIFQQLVLLFSMEGSPCIYYGTEVLLEGGADPDCRRCMPWQEIEEGKYQKTMDIVKKILALRKEIPAFSSGKFYFVEEEQERLIHYVKGDTEGNKVHVYLNCEDVGVKIAEKNDVLFSNLYEDGILEPNGILLLS